MYCSIIGVAPAADSGAAAALAIDLSMGVSSFTDVLLPG
jgi:hypothetical protein